jgi:hypothetical protein
MAADRYAPIVEDDFFFCTLNETREYYVVPKFYSATEVFISSSERDLPASLFRQTPFTWKIKAQAIQQGKVIQEIYLNLEAGWYQETSMDYYKSISLGSFSKVDFKIFPKPVTIRIIVEKTDARYSKPIPTLRVGIRTSPIP